MAHEQTSDVWWVEANNRRFGPYGRDEMIGFVHEGRIVELTRVCTLDQVWRYARSVEWLAPYFSGVAARKVERPSIATAREQSAFVVWARLGTFGGPSFMAELTALGYCVEIEPGFWFLRSKHPLAEARAKLAAATTGDARFVIAAVDEHLVGWRNLGPTTEARVRETLRRAALAPAND